nr:MAG TPA: hypothetical protein [Caudoviricetes sp.]
MIIYYCFSIYCYCCLIRYIHKMLMILLCILYSCSVLFCII